MYRHFNLSKRRFLVRDLLDLSNYSYSVTQIFHIDFSRVEAHRNALRAEGHDVASYVSYVMWAFAQCLTDDAFSIFNSVLRKSWRWKVRIYDGVDVCFSMEVMDDTGISHILLKVIPRVDQLSVTEVHEKLSHVKAECDKRHFPPDWTVPFFRIIPKSLRTWLLKEYIWHFPKLARKLFGTTVFTSVGKFGTDIQVLPRTASSITCGFGRISQQLKCNQGGKVVEYPSAFITLAYDHYLTDGNIIGRFGAKLRKILEDGTFDASEIANTPFPNTLGHQHETN